MSSKRNEQEGSATRSDVSRLVATDLDIFEHPYVKRLESQVEKWEGKYQEQVRRTEEIQMHSQEKILELQRMTGQVAPRHAFPRDNVADCLQLWSPQTGVSREHWKSICRKLDFQPNRSRAARATHRL
jgi:hypothetical protein